MTQQAKLQKYKGKGKPDVGPSTPVVITGGGGGSGEEVFGVPTISFVAPADQPSGLVFHTTPPEQPFWRQSISGLPIRISKVVVDGTPFSIAPDQHPLTLTFTTGGVQRFNIIEVGGDEGKYRVFLNGITQTLFDAIQQSGDGWVAASSEALNVYDGIVIVEELVGLTGGYTVELHFEE